MQLEGLDARLLDASLDFLPQQLAGPLLLALAGLVVPEHLLQTHDIIVIWRQIVGSGQRRLRLGLLLSGEAVIERSLDLTRLFLSLIVAGSGSSCGSFSFSSCLTWMALLYLHSLNWMVFFSGAVSSAFMSLLALRTACWERDFSNLLLAGLPGPSSRWGKKRYWSRFSFSV